MQVAAPTGVETPYAMEAVEPMERCSTEPSESGEIPRDQLTAEERKELRGKKRARGDSAREVTIARMSVPQIKAELMAKGLSTSGLKRELATRLMMGEECGEREEARLCIRA